MLSQKHYDVLQVNEFHTFVGYKKNKVWLIYAYHQKTGQIVAFVWGKRDLKAAFELKQRLKEQNITYDCIASDYWQSFDTVFADANKRWVGKQHTQAIEGNYCAIRHWIGFAYINACHWCKCQKNRI